MRRRRVGILSDLRRPEARGVIGCIRLALVNMHGHCLPLIAGLEGGQIVHVRFFWRLVKFMHLTVVGQKILVSAQVLNVDRVVLVTQSSRNRVMRVLSLGGFHSLHVVFRVRKV